MGKTAKRLALAAMAGALTCACHDTHDPTVDGAVVEDWSSNVSVAARKIAPTAPVHLVVDVHPQRPDGKPWDEGSPREAGLPDLAVCVDFDGRHHCYPGGKHLGGAQCADSSHCEVTVDVPPTGDFEIEVWDADGASHELISRGSCAVGKTCEMGASRVVLEQLRPL